MSNRPTAANEFPAGYGVRVPHAWSDALTRAHVTIQRAAHTPALDCLDDAFELVRNGHSAAASTVDIESLQPIAFNTGFASGFSAQRGLGEPFTDEAASIGPRLLAGVASAARASNTLLAVSAASEIEHEPSVVLWIDVSAPDPRNDAPRDGTLTATRTALVAGYLAGWCSAHGQRLFAAGVLLADTSERDPESEPPATGAVHRLLVVDPHRIAELLYEASDADPGHPERAPGAWNVLLPFSGDTPAADVAHAAQMPAAPAGRDELIARKVQREEIAEQYERQLRLQHELRAYRQAFDGFAGAALLCQADRATVDGTWQAFDANDAFCALVGRTRASLDGQRIDQLFEPHSKESAGHLCDQVTRSQKSARVPLGVVSASPSASPVIRQVTAVPLPDPQGSGASSIVLLIAADAEQTKNEAIAEQERLIAKMEAVSQLSGGIAHDFSNMLTAIMSDCEFLRNDAALVAEHREPVEEILRAARRAAAMTRRLLAISRQEFLRPRAIEVHAFLLGCEKRLRAALPSNIELVLGGAADAGQILADPEKLEQVLLLLTENALEAMPKGGTLRIEARATELGDAYLDAHVSARPGPHAMITVSDTGVGMDAATRSRAFEPFFTTKRTGPGSGLGLSIAYGLVKQTGGNIWLYSEPFHGTTVKIYLPRLPSNPGAVTRRLQQAPTTQRTILLVDDEELSRSATARALRRAGYVVIEAQNAIEAIDAQEARREQIDLLVTDICMPRLNGRELAERLLRNHPMLRVLFLSGYPSNLLTQQELLDAGASFLEKPFSSTALLEQVASVLAEHP